MCQNNSFISILIINLCLNGNWEFTASIKNLFDKKAYEPSDGRIADDYPLNERRFYAEVRYHLPR